MTTETVIDDVNADDVVEDNVMDDHDAGLGSSAEDMETHNPDIADYDKAIADMDASDDDEVDTSGGTVNTDDAADSDADASDADKDDKDKDDDKDEPRIPRSRLNEVILKGEEAAKAHHEKELEWARKEAIFEGRLAALEKPVATDPVVDPLDEILKGEPQAVLDKFTEDPAAFIRMVQDQAKQETTTSIQAQREEANYQKALTAGLDKFRDDHEDFMPNAQKLVGIMDSNPIHNVISAYAYEIEIPALTAKLEEATQGVEDKIAAARAEGVAEGKKEAIKEIQAKGNATVLDGSSAKQSGGKANAGAHLETGGDGTKLRETITADLLKSRAAQG